MPSTFEIEIVQKQATPGPVITAIGTGSLATRVEFFISLLPVAPAQPSGPVVVPQAQVTQQG